MTRLVYLRKRYIYRATFKELWGFITLHNQPTKLALKLKNRSYSEIFTQNKKVKQLKKLKKIIFKIKEIKNCNLNIFKKIEQIEKVKFLHILINLNFLFNIQQSVILSLILFPRHMFIKNYPLKNNIFYKLYIKKLVYNKNVNLESKSKTPISNNKITLWTTLIKQLAQKTRFISSQQPINQQDLSFHSLFQFKLLRKRDLPIYNTPNELNYRYTFTRQKLIQHLIFFKIYKQFLFFGWDISKYNNKLNIFYNKIKNLLYKYQISTQTLLEYSLINILYKSNFGQYIYQTKFWINSGFFMVNRICIQLPECTIMPWDLVSPISNIRILIFKFILNRLQKTTTLHNIKTKYNIILHKPNAQLYYKRLNQTGIYRKKHKKFNFLNKKKDISNKDKFQLYYYKYYNSYKHPILLNYPNFLEITYLCLIICPFRNLKPIDSVKYFTTLPSKYN